MQKANPELTAAQERYDELNREVHRLVQAQKANPGDTATRQALATARHQLSAADSRLVSLRSRAVRDSFNERIAILQNEIRALDIDIGDATLAAMEAPDDTQRAEYAAELTRRRDGHEQSIRDIQLARDAAERRAQGQTHEARTRELASLRTQHREAHEHAVKQAREWVDWLAEAGVRWASAQAAVQEVERVARDMIRLAGDDRTAKRWITYMEGRYLSPLVDATVGVLSTSQMADGALAPHMEIRRYTSFQNHKKPSPAFDMEAEMSKAFHRQLTALAEFDPEAEPEPFFPGIPVSKDFYELDTREQAPTTEAKPSKGLRSVVNKLMH